MESISINGKTIELVATDIRRDDPECMKVSIANNGLWTIYQAGVRAGLYEHKASYKPEDRYDIVDSNINAIDDYYGGYYARCWDEIREYLKGEEWQLINRTPVDLTKPIKVEMTFALGEKESEIQINGSPAKLDSYLYPALLQVIKSARNKVQNGYII